MFLFSIAFSTSATRIYAHPPCKIFVANSQQLPDLTKYGRSRRLSLNVSIRFRWTAPVYSKVSNFFRVGYGSCFYFTVENLILLDIQTCA